MKISYDKGLPIEVKREIKPLLERNKKLIPGWVNDLHVKWVAYEGEGSIMSISIATEYRNACIEVYPLFLDCDASDRDSSIVHELVHLMVAPLQRFTQKIIKEFFEDGNVKNILLEDLRVALEESVCDTEIAITKLKQK